MSKQPKKEFIAQVDQHGRISGLLRKTIADLIAKVPGKKIRITISLYRKRRSSNQNAFYWGMVLPLITHALNDAGNDMIDDEVHEMIKHEIWRHIKIITLPNGEKRQVTKSSTILSTTEWEANIEKTRAWAAEFGIYIPFPNEEGMLYG